MPSNSPKLPIVSRRRPRRAKCCGGSRKHDPEVGESTKLRRDLDFAGVLLHDNVVAQRESEPRALAGGFRCEKGIEPLVLTVRRDAGAIVTYSDLNAVAQAPRRG